MKVRFAALAREDLNRLIDSVAAIDPERAFRLNNGFNVAVRAIAMAPFRCPQVSGSAQIGIRKKAWRPHLVFFRVRGGEVLLVRILHERSDWTSLV